MNKLRKIRPGVYTSDSKPRKVDAARIQEILSNALKPSVVYTIHVLSGDPENRIKDFSFRSRNWGFYFKQEDAAHVIEHNETDISELDYYHYAVLSAKGEGPLAIAETIQWYEFVWASHLDPSILLRLFLEARKIDCPEQYKNLVF
jgi:hypothetical protein